MRNVPNEENISPAIAVTGTQLLLPKSLIKDNSPTLSNFLMR